MKYINETSVSTCCESVPAPTSVANQARSMRACATDALITARKINQFLFGPANQEELKQKDPECFRDDITATGELLAALMEELCCMCNLLGV